MVYDVYVYMLITNGEKVGSGVCYLKTDIDIINQ